MSMYTTGELAKKCNVSVRTVQYYDERGILIPSELSEGGRRLFSEKDVETLETICFLRDLGISIKDIAEILESEESKDVVRLLLEQQEETLKKELKEKSEKLQRINRMQNMMDTFSDASEESIHDISTIMKSRKNLRKLYLGISIPAIVLEIGEIAALVYAIRTQNWVPFVTILAVVIAFVIFAFNYWYKRVNYICPKCHTEFSPNKMEVFWAGHTPKTRKLTCPCCNEKVWCIETFKEA